MNRARRRLFPAAALSLSLSVLLTGCGGETEASEILGTPTASASTTTTDAYEPATPEHPARNVPRPVLSEQAKENSEAGARAFLQHWADCVNYMVQTGDSGPLKAIQTSDNHSYDKVIKIYKEDYQKGNWTTGNSVSVYGLDEKLGKFEKYKTIKFHINRTPGTIWGKQGKVDSVSPGDDVNVDLTAYILPTGSGWKLHGYRLDK